MGRGTAIAAQGARHKGQDTLRQRDVHMLGSSCIGCCTGCSGRLQHALVLRAVWCVWCVKEQYCLSVVLWACVLAAVRVVCWWHWQWQVVAGTASIHCCSGQQQV
jgi:hypothetical protein